MSVIIFFTKARFTEALQSGTKPRSCNHQRNLTRSIAGLCASFLGGFFMHNCGETRLELGQVKITLAYTPAGSCQGYLCTWTHLHYATCTVSPAAEKWLVWFIISQS